MPELPEVETARLCLERWARGRRIEGVVVHDPRVVGGRRARQDLAALEGARFQRFDRRGKHLLLTLLHDRRPVGLWSHLGMTGKWVLRARGEDAPRFSRVELPLDDGSTLHYVDMRLFGRLRLVPGADFAAVPEIAALGPDPLLDGVDVDRLRERLAKVKQPIKLALMEQGLLAGLGNIQVNEALHRAALDPRRPARSLSPAEVGRLARGIRDSLAATLRTFAEEGVLRRARDIRYVEEAGTPNPFRVYGHEGAKCPRCRRGTIARIVQGGRSTFFCPECLAHADPG